jgi:superfamily II DNA/RNA helicase
MLDMGFIPDIERICKLVPFTRQTLFFSATMPPEIARLTNTFLSNPARIEVSKPATMVATVTQILIATAADPEKKREVLRRLIRDAEGLKNGIIFCNRKTEVAKLHRSLVKHRFSAVALHGDMDQRSRMNALEAFRKNEVTLLVASDVAARGLDIPEVSHIFNFDVPHHAEDYVHRIGRTGRAGRSGAAITLAAPADKKSLAAIERLIGQSIAWAAKSERAETAGTSPEPVTSHRHREGRGSRSPRPAHSGRPAKPAAPPAARPVHYDGRPATPAAPPAADPDRQNDQSHLPAFLLRPVPVKAS